jgi:Global regulator protein family
MLILRRKEGQWIDITHRSGDVIRVRVCNVRARYPGQVDLALDDDARNFVIQRPERAAKQQALADTAAAAVALHLSLGPPTDFLTAAAAD